MCNSVKRCIKSRLFEVAVYKSVYICLIICPFFAPSFIIKNPFGINQTGFYLQGSQAPPLYNYTTIQSKSRQPVLQPFRSLRFQKCHQTAVLQFCLALFGGVAGDPNDTIFICPGLVRVLNFDFTDILALCQIVFIRRLKALPLSVSVYSPYSPCSCHFPFPS